jgi:hypothetical protein
MTEKAIKAENDSWTKGILISRIKKHVSAHTDFNKKLAGCADEESREEVVESKSIHFSPGMYNKTKLVTGDFRRKRSSVRRR